MPLRAGLFLLSRTPPASLLRSTERIFPAGSLNQAIVGPLPRGISFSLADPPAREDFRSSLGEGGSVLISAVTASKCQCGRRLAVVSSCYRRGSLLTRLRHSTPVFVLNSMLAVGQLAPFLFYGVERWTFAAFLSAYSSWRRHQRSPSSRWLCSTASAAEECAASAEPDARNGRDLAARPRLRVTRSEIAIHEFGRQRHHDQSKNPAHHTTGSKLATRRVVLKFNSSAPETPTRASSAHDYAGIAMVRQVDPA